jgi:N6-L-threonylcarbamoyladenine synthase
MAKREHAKNLIPLLEAALEEAELLKEDTQALASEKRDAIAKLLEREYDLSEAFFAFIGECEVPAIDAIAVTAGPGLEPALWVGINLAQALAIAWDKPLIPVNHMEGHIMAALATKQEEILTIENVAMPVLALLISGGHTELVNMPTWLTYELIGQTRDDAVGEAFDKVARMLGLPYPGGPEISKLAERDREDRSNNSFALPRPMINDNSCDFSFAGLKTAALYMIKDKELTEQQKQELAREFEDAVAEVLWKKTARALEQTNAKTLVIGGGVSANTHIRRVFKEKMEEEFPQVTLRIPTASLTTDNALMIALAGYFRALNNDFATTIIANGNLSLA